MKNSNASPDRDPGHRTGSQEKRVKSHQRLRLQRLILAICNYSVFGVITLYLYHDGQVSLPLYGNMVVVTGIVAANSVFFLLIVTGRNLHFADPSLTGAQLLLAPAFEITMFLFSRTVFAQDLFLFSFLLSTLFGAFRFDFKRNALYALPGFTGFATIMLLPSDFVIEPVSSTLARVAVYTVLFGWILIFSGYISQLRHHLSKRNKQIKRAMHRIEELAIRDELTGAYNRRFTHDRLSTEMRRAERAGDSLAVCLLDLDYFKRINDMHGHQVGDEVLRDLVKRIRNSIRQYDELGENDELNMLSRYGGEEFLLILPMTGLQDALACAERVCKVTRMRPFMTKVGNIRVSVSCGVALYRSGDTLETLIGRTDEALYRAKENGRDRVEAELMRSAESRRQSDSGVRSELDGTASGDLPDFKPHHGTT